MLPLTLGCVHGYVRSEHHLSHLRPRQGRYTRGNYRDEDPVGSVDFGPPDPDPLIFGPPDPDPTCDNGFIKLFSF